MFARAAWIIATLGIRRRQIVATIVNSHRAARHSSDSVRVCSADRPIDRPTDGTLTMTGRAVMIVCFEADKRLAARGDPLRVQID
jgi:hypothetical protein